MESPPISKKLSWIPICGIPRTSDHTAPKISFNYMGEFDSDVNTEWFQLSSLSSGQEISPEEIWSYKFKFISMLRNNQLVIRLEYSMNQFAKETIETLLQNYLANIRKVAESMYVH